MRILLILLLGLFVSVTHTATGQPKLPTGLYKLSNEGICTLTLDGKTYHTNAKPIALLKDIDNFSVSQNRSANSYYNLNIVLDAEATQNVKNIPSNYGESIYVGLIISGKLVSVLRWVGPITTGKLSIGSKSKSELEQIAAQLKAEKNKK